MEIAAARKALEKIQTLIEDLTENFPELGGGDVDHAFSELEAAGTSIDAAIDLLSSADDEEEEE
jgi:hypothetical protein